MSTAETYTHEDWLGGHAPALSLPRTWGGVRAISAGLLVTLLQLGMALLLLAPPMPPADRYQSLVQHDSYWFENIVNRGYETIVPPISRKMMEVSNVAFFPAYPLLAHALGLLLGVSASTALLLVAQAAAWGFWSYFFLFCQRWQIAPLPQFLGALSIASHPGAFFLIVAYSESLFLMALLGFIYWSASQRRGAFTLAAIHGFAMSATRIVGLPCALAPLVARLWSLGWRRIKDFSAWLRNYSAPILLSGMAMLGSVSFFVYCQFRWGRWDMYMLTQQSGWGIEPDYLAVFKPTSYRWLIPSLANPTQVSQMAMTIGAIMLVVLIAVDLLRRHQPETGRGRRIAIYFVAAVIYFISVSGVACVEMESMLRYEFCVHALIVLALLQYLHNVPVRSQLGRAAGVTAIAVSCAAGLALEGWFIWNFTRGNWVA
ncbi:MAG: hypothetical protein ABI839_01135 [Verrucomicrobiota bacterium]